MYHSIGIQKAKSSHEINIEIPKEVLMLKIYNADGRLIKKNTTEGKTKAQIQFKKNGCYFLHLFYPNEIYIRYVEV